MKRLVITFAAAAALAVAMPATGLAKHHHNSGHHKHGKSHHARMLRFGSLSSAPTGTTGPSGPSGDQPSNDTAGTVDTFVNGVLTIKLNDGTSVSGKVTTDTEIECEAPETQGATGDDDANDGAQDQDTAPQTTTPTAHESDDNQSGDSGDNESGDNEDQSSSCGTAALTPGTVVKEAELEVGSSGAVFHSIHLIK